MANFALVLALAALILAPATARAVDDPPPQNAFKDDLKLPPPNESGTLENLNKNFQGNSGNSKRILAGKGEVHQVFGDEYEIRSTADYLNKLTRHPGFARALKGLNTDSGLVSRMAVFYKKCQGNNLVTVPDGPPTRLNTRKKEYCAVNLPYEPNPVDGSRQSRNQNVRKNNNYEVICICP